MNATLPLSRPNAYQRCIVNTTCELDGDVAHTETYYMFVAMNRTGQPLTMSGGRHRSRLPGDDSALRDDQGPDAAARMGAFPAAHQHPRRAHPAPGSLGDVRRRVGAGEPRPRQ